jgi:DNA-binding beta-propeller fold protein YncE
MTKALYTVIFCLIAIIIFNSCKKEPQQKTIEPDKPAKPTATDSLQLLVGFWKMQDNGTYISVDFKSDGTYIIDYTNLPFGIYSGNYAVKNSIVTLYQNGSIVTEPFKIDKLDADSLVYHHGNFYFRHSREFKLTSAYNITTIGGNGSKITDIWYGSQALQSPIAQPTSIAQDKDGNVYFTSSLNSSISIIDHQTKTLNKFDDKVPLSDKVGWWQSIYISNNGDMFLSDYANLYKYNFSTKITTKILEIRDILSITGDKNNNIYICVNERASGIIYRIDAITGKAEKILGTYETVQFDPTITSPFGLDIRAMQMAVDKEGNLLIPDSWRRCVWKYNVTSKTIKLIAGIGNAGFSGDNGPASLAKFEIPTGIAVDNAGNIFIADWHNSRIRKIDTNGIITTIAGRDYGLDKDGDACDSSLDPQLLFFNSSFGDLLVTDSKNFKIKKVVLK